MLRLLVVLIACGCQASTQRRPPLAVNAPPQPSAESTDTTARSAPPAVELAAEQFEFFADEIDVDDGEKYIDGTASKIGPGLVLVGNRASGALGVLHTDTWKIDAVAPYVGEPKQRPTITNATEHNAVVATFTDERQRTVSFQVLRLDTLRWERAGRFDIPPSRALDDERRFSSSWVQMRDGQLWLDLSDEVEKRKSYVLDFETLVWREVAPVAVDHGPCLMSSTFEDDDRLRWGLSATDKSATSCVAVRASTQDHWRLLEAPGDLLFMRSMRPIDERRFLVTGGFKFAMFPFAHQADVVDVVSGEIRPLGKQATGTELEVPGEPFVWLNKDAVVRFDPQSEQFRRAPGPQLEFTPQWWIELDDRRVLFAGRDDEKVARFVVAGFRPVP